MHERRQASIFSLRCMLASVLLCAVLALLAVLGSDTWAATSVLRAAHQPQLKLRRPHGLGSNASTHERNTVDTARSLDPKPSTNAKAAQERRHGATDGSGDTATSAPPPSPPTAPPVPRAHAWLQPLQHNVVMSVNYHGDYAFLPPLACLFWHRLGIRPYVLLYHVKRPLRDLLVKYIRAFGGVPLLLSKQDNPKTYPFPTQSRFMSPLRVVSKRRYRLPASKYAQAVRLLGPCAITRAAFRDYGATITWPSDAFLWVGDVDDFFVNKSYITEGIRHGAPLHVWHGRCCALQKSAKWWQPMLPMGYIGARVPIFREVFEPPEALNSTRAARAATQGDDSSVTAWKPSGDLTRCDIGAAMQALLPDPALYNHVNLDQITAMRRADAFCSRHFGLNVTQDFLSHPMGQERCVQTKPGPVRAGRWQKVVSCANGCDDIHVRRPLHHRKNWHEMFAVFAHELMIGEKRLLKQLKTYHREFCSLDRVRC